MCFFGFFLTKNSTINKMADRTSPLPEIIIEAVNNNVTPQLPSPIQRKCPSCGRTDHMRRSSKKCPNYVARAQVNTENIANRNDTQTATAPNTTNIAPTESTDTETSSKDDVDNNNGTGSTDIINSNSLNDVNISKPNFIKLDNPTAAEYKPVVDVSSKTFTIQECIFKVFARDHRDRKRELPAEPHILLERFFTDEFMMKFVVATNKYIANRKQAEPNLYCWKDSKTSADVTQSNLFQFFAILYYFGIVVLPSKSDYWSTTEWMPQHSIVSEFGMTRRRFEFIWRHFHPSFESSDDTEDERKEEEEEEEDTIEEALVSIGFERVQREQDDNMESNEYDENTEPPQQSTKKVWYEKLTFMIEHIRQVSQEFVHVLGTILSLDEMMIRFFGRSGETHRMKNKPIKEGYKFFVLATKEGFILNFTPDGRKAARAGEQEYESNRDMGKVESMILFLIKIIDSLKDRQLKRIQNSTNKRKTRASDEAQFDEQIMGTFCLAMDNYFTLPKVMLALRKANIGCVGTARFRGKNWPPKILKDVKKEDANFNDFFWTVDEYATLVARWMDNGMVFCISTMHKAGKDIARVRKRPRVTQNNRRHVSDIWGDKGSTKIRIPTLIDDYNYWMGGVDVADQRISYYHPSKLVCNRTWIPIFIQLLSIIRNNAYIIHRKNIGKNHLAQKEFAQKMISWLMTRARETNINGRNGNVASPTKKATAPRKRKAPSLSSAVNELSNRFPSRFITPKELHARTGIRRGTCVYCSALYFDKKKRGEEVEFVRETKRTLLHCSFCTLTASDKSTCFLCKKHFDIFHAM